jgi:hypothetical protein
VSRWEFDTAFNQLGLPARFEASNICFKWILLREASIIES